MHSNFFTDHKKVFCLWEMRELWDFSKEEHEKLAEFVLWKADFVFVVGESMKKYFLPKMLELWCDSENVKYFENSFKLWEYLKNFLENSNDKYLLLFKWSQNTIFLEESIKFILKNKSDEENLCRQDSFWLGKKNAK
jgi:UDP-N-acetylmuramyl pentapeptide synthase